MSLKAFSALDHLACPRCGARHEADRLNGLCSCGSPLLAAYDLERAAATMTPDDLARRPPSLWRYHEVLPVREPGRVVSLGEGMTPLTPLARLGAEIGVPRLYMKDEGLLPTGSFKARGAAVAVSRAVELGVRAVAMPTNRNAGAAWASYAARAGIASLIVMPERAPTITRAECAAAGASLVLVRGHIGDAARIVAQLVAGSGGAVFDTSTLKEPYRIEGKKTMAYEIVEQLGWQLPDVIVYPTGGGVGLIGIHRALDELTALGWARGPMPRLVCVQAAGCAPIVRAFEHGLEASEPWESPRTVAFGIAVPKALGDFLVLRALAVSSGTALAVEDVELLEDQRRCARLEGAFICPEGAAGISAVRRLRQSGWLGRDERVVLLNTGAGIKYPETVDVRAPVVDPGAVITWP
jgi:threonine synthase